MPGPDPDADLFVPIRARLQPIADAFAAAGHELHLVGGLVRDTLVGTGDAHDVDCTTGARPGQISALLQPFASAMWTQGERFGTIGALIGDAAVEVTTFRAEQYDATTRKPSVTFGDALDDDLARRDFTINAMAVSLHDGAVHDPFGGLDDLRAHRLRTPLDPEVSFTDDPLRILRAARFLPRFDLVADPGLVDAATRLADRLDIVSKERIHAELERLLEVDDPARGVQFLIDCGLVERILGTVPPSDVVAALAPLSGVRPRRVALLLALGVDGARSVLEQLRYSTTDRSSTELIVELVESMPTRSVDAAGVRRLLRDAGHDRELLDDALDVCERLGVHAAVAGELRHRIESLAAEEDLAAVRGPLDGAEIMAELGVSPGPMVGQALAYLEECRLENGPMRRDDAIAALRGWWQESPRPIPDGERR